MSGVVSTKLRFKGDKPKKKKRSHREREVDEFADDPQGWMFPTVAGEIAGPSFLLLPTTPLTCLAWDPTRQRVYAAPVEIPQAPEGAADLSAGEVLAAVEPADVNHVWVVTRLAGSEEISLRTSTGTFLTASPSGTLSATTPSRGPLEGFSLTLKEGTFPTAALKTHAGTYLSIPDATAEDIAARKALLRADAEEIGDAEGIRVKCQREFVLKARLDNEKDGGVAKRRMMSGPAMGSVEDEMRRNAESQAWGGGQHRVSGDDRKALRRAAKEGRLAEAMLDRRAAMKSDKYAK